MGITAEKAESHELKLAMQELIKDGSVQEAYELFYKYTQIRPDVMLALSDINGDLKYIEILLFLMNYEETNHIAHGLKQYSNDLKVLLEHIRKLERILSALPDTEECGYLIESGFSLDTARKLLSVLWVDKEEYRKMSCQLEGYYQKG